MVHLDLSGNGIGEKAGVLLGPGVSKFYSLFLRFVFLKHLMIDKMHMVWYCPSDVMCCYAYIPIISQ